MPHISLPSPLSINVPLSEAMKQRRSSISGDDRTPISLQEMGTLLGVALGRKEDSVRRHYPSGGGLFPVETYVISSALEGQAPGAFHYDPTTHSLERLADLPPGLDMKDLAKRPEELILSTLIVLTSVWSRSSVKYGDLAYPNALLEAGHMGENVLLVGCALGLRVRPYAGFNDTLIEDLLDLDETSEQTVHTITLSRPPRITNDEGPTYE